MNQLTNYRQNRIVSIDILRGAIMLIMAIDHIRDFTYIGAMTGDPTDLATTTPALFLTRWITHFCAPIFVFLSGMSAWLSGQRKTKKELSSFLIKRGIWLILVEIVVISLLISLNPLYNFVLLQVIWAIGWGMIFLGLLVRTSYTAIVIVGLVLFFGHNITNYLGVPSNPVAAAVYNIFLTTPGTPYFYAPQRLVLDAYAILPWTGFMLLGYAFGKLFRQGSDVVERRKHLLRAGLIFLALFLLLRFVNGYGDPAPWSVQKNTLFTIFSFINITKYPPSLQYGFLMIGFALVLLALLDKASGRFASFLRVFGKVPFFYYVCHWFLIHTITVILFFASGYDISQAIDPQSPFLFRPVSFGFELHWVYVIWLTVILLLYYPCRWFMRYKETHDQWWLSYL